MQVDVSEVVKLLGLRTYQLAKLETETQDFVRRYNEIVAENTQLKKENEELKNGRLVEADNCKPLL